MKAQGGSVTWLAPKNYDNLGPDAAKLIDTAVSQGADGVVGPDWVPEAQDAAFKKVVGGSAPVVIYNAGGIEAADSVGALNYVGSEEAAAGKAGGEFFGRERPEERPVRQHAAGRREHRGALQGRRRWHSGKRWQELTAPAAVVEVR